QGRADPVRPVVVAVAPVVESAPGGGAPGGPPAKPVAGRHARGAVSQLLATPPPAPGRPRPVSRISRPGPATDHRPGELRRFLALPPRAAVCRLGGDPGGLQPRR